jgi:hypothetical protein
MFTAKTCRLMLFGEHGEGLSTMLRSNVRVSAAGACNFYWKCDFDCVFAFVTGKSRRHVPLQQS